MINLSMLKEEWDCVELVTKKFSVKVTKRSENLFTLDYSEYNRSEKRFKCEGVAETEKKFREIIR